MLQRLAQALVALAVITLVIALALPRGWHVEESVEIAAPPERIYPFLATPRRWLEWGPWNKELDPLGRHTFSGPETGVGSEWAWLGPRLGRGRLRIVEADPRRGVLLDEALESEQINAHARLEVTVLASGTRVRWIDEGTLPLLAGAFRGQHEERLSGYFRKGLATLKQKVEELPPPPPPRVVEIIPMDAGAAVPAQPDGGAQLR